VSFINSRETLREKKSKKQRASATKWDKADLIKKNNFELVNGGQQKKPMGRGNEKRKGPSKQFSCGYGEMARGDALTYEKRWKKSRKGQLSGNLQKNQKIKSSTRESGGCL